MGTEELWAVEYVVLCYGRVVVVVMIVCLFDLVPHRWSALSACCLRASYSRFPFAFPYTTLHHVLTLPSRELARKYRIVRYAMAEACFILIPLDSFFFRNTRLYRVLDCTIAQYS